MKLYVASSWRNKRYEAVLAALREAGHECYDFKNPVEGNTGFSWRQVADTPKEEWTPEFYRNVVLNHPVARDGFAFDMKALREAEACVLVLPCGRSAHLELGYATGAGKLTFVLLDDKIDEPELMYLMNTSICIGTDELIRALKSMDKPMFKRGNLILQANRNMNGGKLNANQLLSDLFENMFNSPWLAKFTSEEGARLGKKIKKERDGDFGAPIGKKPEGE